MIVDDLKRSVHISLNRKGGCGKTTTTALLCEWLLKAGALPIVYDADAQNVDACISNYSALHARRLPLLKTGLDGAERIDEVAFHGLVESLLTEEGPHVIDTGASTYTQWMSYVRELGLADELEAMGKNVYAHVVVAGGDMTAETVLSLEAIAAAVPWPIVVWLNEFAGPAKLPSGQRFLDSAAYQALAPRIRGVVHMRPVTPIQAAARERLAPLHLLPHQVRALADIQVAERLTYASWARQAESGLDVAFGSSREAAAKAA